jgi:hypothetical protein
MVGSNTEEGRGQAAGRRSLLTSDFCLLKQRECQRDAREGGESANLHNPTSLFLSGVLSYGEAPLWASLTLLSFLGLSPEAPASSTGRVEYYYVVCSVRAPSRQMRGRDVECGNFVSLRHGLEESRINSFRDSHYFNTRT